MMNKSIKKWYQFAGDSADVAISTRIRLARNLRGIPFPGVMSEAQRQDVNKQVKDALLGGKSIIGKDFTYIELGKIPELELVSMVERHLISPEFAKNPSGRGLVVSKDESVSIMICEEDHIRIQVLRPGLALVEAFDYADKIDTLLSESLDYAFDDKLGYLTSCPTNLGTGMRASVMMHLTVMEQSGVLGKLTDNIVKLGLTIRGMYGEGSPSKAGFYQISNRETLGQSEPGVLQKLLGIINQVAEIERKCRKEVISHPEFADTVCRSLGLLRSARMLSGEEFAQLYSTLRVGVSMGMETIAEAADEELNIPKKTKFPSMDDLASLFIDAQPATLSKGTKKKLTPADRDKMRAEMVRKAIHNA